MRAIKKNGSDKQVGLVTEPSSFSLLFPCFLSCVDWSRGLRALKLNSRTAGGREIALNELLDGAGRK